MLLSAEPRRDRAADPEAAERLRSVRERVEATTSGLGELDFLRQRQEVLVRAALELREAERHNEPELSSEEKLLEENILLLRKQLNCLRRRDAGLISQLQELDRQICDLHLDAEAPGDLQESDSRPSSGFYELSDAASGSLSNSSNSVFSECFCSTVEADKRLPSTDELAGCLDCGLCDDSYSSAVVRRSSSAPHPPTPDPSPDSQWKFLCDLVARNGGDVYRYPSPLHAVAVQSPAFLHVFSHGSRSKEAAEAGGGALASLPSPTVYQSSSWPAPQTRSPKRLDGYIYSLLQRRALPRTSKPRTSIRKPGLGARQGPGPSPSEPRVSWMAAGASAEDAAASSPHRPRLTEAKCDGPETQTGFRDAAPDPNGSPVGVDANELHTKKSRPCHSTVKPGDPDLEAEKHERLESSSQSLDAGRAAGRRPAEPDRRGHRARRSSRRGAGGAAVSRCLPASIPEGRVPDKQPAAAGVRSGVARHHHGNQRHHHRDQIVVVAKPKHKRSDYRRPRAVPDVPCDEAFRRRQRREPPSSSGGVRRGGATRGPNSYIVGSDSEFSAECVSLFHSTVVDTSEDETSNYTSNRFGDGESSEKEHGEESGDGGAVGRRRRPVAGTAAVRIRATRSLKKRILRFGSGSLKLMTTV